jgi:hypothetical protein
MQWQDMATQGLRLLPNPRQLPAGAQGTNLLPVQDAWPEGADVQKELVQIIRNITVSRLWKLNKADILWLDSLVEVNQAILAGSFLDYSLCS